MISLQQVRKEYADGTVAVHDLDLDVGRGEGAVLIGPSGCGKTTTMRMINRLVEPSGGRIFVDGADVTTADPVKLRRTIGYVIQQVGLFPHETVRDNVATVPRLLGWDRNRTRARVGELLELVGLDPDRFAKRYPHELSGGQRQRVGVARALAADPPVLLMDEPFGAVDPIARDRLQVEFLRLQETVRKTVVFVTHDMDEAVRVGDRIAVMREGGHLEQYAAPAELFADPATPFVADFVGSERSLRRLSVTHIRREQLVDWPTAASTSPLSDCAARLDQLEAGWLVVFDDGVVAGVLMRDEASGDGIAGDRLRRVAPVDVTTSLESVMAAILVSPVGAAIVTEDGRYTGVLGAAGVVASAR
ncbi:MAG: betaine/proline/choline family ABC transporter ATP-binding protein [Frankiales bacterium]|nr:betaine/proline/choline family ABC transporter ATP-binding protein [Frankiales bacterium]